MSNVNKYRSKIFYFEDKAYIWKFILLYKDLFKPYSLKTNAEIIVYGFDDYRKWYVNTKDENVRNMMNQGYVIRDHSIICMLDKDDFMNILNNSGMTFEVISVDYYRKIYKYVS